MHKRTTSTIFGHAKQNHRNMTPAEAWLWARFRASFSEILRAMSAPTRGPPSFPLLTPFPLNFFILLFVFCIFLPLFPFVSFVFGSFGNKV
jgi:hypothetical protein